MARRRYIYLPQTTEVERCWLNAAIRFLTSLSNLFDRCYAQTGQFIPDGTALREGDLGAQGSAASEGETGFDAVALSGCEAVFSNSLSADH